MIKKIVSFSVYHPVSVLMLHLALLVCCCIGLYTIQLDFMPKMNERFLLIASDFTGVSAQDMRKLVTIPVEDAAASLKGIKNISSVTRDGLSLVVVELHWNVDADIAIVECREIIDQCYEALPSGCAKPNVAFFNPVHRETLTLVVFPNDGDLEYGRHIVDTDIRPHLQRVKGVGSVSVAGGEKPEIKVRLDKAKLESIPVSLQSVAEILSHANFEYPAGNVSDGNKELLFRTSGLFTSLGDIEDAPFFYSDGGVLKIKDVGTVSLGTEKKESFFTYNGREAICVKIHKKTDASPLAVSKKLTKEIERLRNSYGGNFTFKIVFDLSDELTASIRNLCASAAVGAVITAIVLFLFLRTLRMSLLAASLMPLSILFSVFVLALCGKTVNILSVSGMTIGIGMVIDPAAVAIENILEKLKRHPDSSAAESIADGVAETALSSSGSAVTTIAAFVPFFFFPGLFGKLFSDMALAVIASIAFSFVLAMTYVPAAAALQSEKLIKLCARVPAVPYGEKLYGDCLKTIFEKKHAISLLLTACVCVGTLSALLLKKELLPVSPSGTVGATIRYGTAPSLDALFSDAEFINRALSAEDCIDTVCISGGVEKNDYEQLAAPEAKKETLSVTCGGKHPKKIAAVLDAILQSTDMRYTIESSRNLLEEMLASDAAPLIVTAPSPEAAAETALAVCDERDIVPYDTVQEAMFIPDRNACARFSVSASHAAAAAYTALEGAESNAFYKGGRKIPLRVSFADGSFTAVDQLMRAGVVAGKIDIPLSALGTVERVTNEKTLYRWNRKDAKKICGAPKEKSIDNFAADFQRSFKRQQGTEASARIHSGAVVSLRDMQMKEFFKSAAALLAVVFLLLYCIMGAQFESFVIPLLMFASIPPAFAGAFVLLLLCDRSLNIHSVIALVVLFGTAVNNAIILYESIIRRKKITEKSVIAASVEKLRSILITTLTTVFAVVPFAVDPLRKNQQSSMALAIIGGLIASFAVVLAVMPPLLFSVLKRRRSP